MNLEHLDPFGQHCPEVVEGTLSNSDVAVCCEFNFKGNLLATGSLGGTCTVWDMDTRGTARTLVGHVERITSVSWSRSGRYLLTASADWNCILWDLKDGSRARTIRFDCPVESARMHATQSNAFIVILTSGTAELVKLPENFKGKITRLRLADAFAKATTSTQAREEKCKSACIDPKGAYIYIGTHKGNIVILDFETFTIRTVHRACTAGIRGLHLDGKGRDLVVNANDKSIRVFTVREEAGEILLENEQRFLDSVNPLPWAQATFSADGEFVLGGSDVKYAHRIYMWNRHVGNLVKVLDGDRDGLTDLSAHPYKPMLASVCASGKVFIWTANFKPRYSALAPEFQELEENLDYEERESEFDTDEDEPLKRRKEEVADAQDIDIVTIARVNTYDDGDTADAFILPINFRSQEAATHETDEPPWQWHIKV